MAWGAVAGAALGGISSIFGASSANKAQKRLDGYNTALYEFNWQQDNRNRDFQISQNAAQRTNLANDKQYSLQTQIRDYQYSTMMDTSRYNFELAAYKKSDDISQTQLQLNNASLDLALKQQGQFMAEQELGYTFRTADLGLQLQSAVNDYTLSMFSESTNRLVADQERDKTIFFSGENKRLSIQQANEDLGLTSNIANARANLTNQQANEQYGLSVESSQLRSEQSIKQAGEVGALSSKNAQDTFGNQVKNLKADQEQLKTTTSREQEKAAIDGMRQKGEAKTNQAGKSTAKLIQSIGFIAGLNQATLSDRILFGEEGTYRKIADASLGMQQTIEGGNFQARQSMEGSILTDKISNKTAKLSRNQTVDQSNFTKNSTISEADLRRKQITDAETLKNSQNVLNAEIGRSQAYASSDLRIKQSENELNKSKASISMNQSGALASLISARIANSYTVGSINADKYAADLNAYANKMLDPMAPITRPAPLLMPETILLDPPALVKPPKPVAGASVSPVGAALGTVAGFLPSIFPAN